MAILLSIWWIRPRTRTFQRTVEVKTVEVETIEIDKNSVDKENAGNKKNKENNLDEEKNKIAR